MASRGSPGSKPSPGRPRPAARRRPAQARPAAPSRGRSTVDRGREPEPQPTSAVPSPARARLTGRAAVLFLVLGLLVVAYAWPLREYVRQRSELRSLHQQSAALQARVNQLDALRNRWQDPSYVAAQARDRLHFVRPGETGYVVLGPDHQPVVDPLPQAAPTAPAWFTQLWDTVKAADVPDASR